MANKIKVITSLQTLMRLAKDVGDAKRTGDAQAIEEAERKHNAYKELCLSADEMATGYTFGSLYENGR